MIDVAGPNGQTIPQARGSGGVGDYLSASRLNTWMSCPLKFKLRYIDGVRSPATPAMFVGKQVHRGLEIYYRHRMLGVTLEAGNVVERMDASWEAAVAEEDMRFTDVAEESKLRRQATELVSCYLGQVPSDEPAPQAVEVTLEAPLVDPFTGENLGIPLLGIVDLIMPDDGDSTIVDFKTSSRSAPPFEITHEIQLSCYSYLFRAHTGEKETGLEIRSLVKTRKPRIEQQEYPACSQAHLRRLFAVIREYLDALDRGRFTYRPGWSCAMCEHRDGPCRSWAG